MCESCRVTSLSRVIGLWLVTLVAFGGWQSTVAPDFVGSPLWNLGLAGAFWAGVVISSQATADLLRETLMRYRIARAGRRHATGG
jgi:hypothetical protein